MRMRALPCMRKCMCGYVCVCETVITIKYLCESAVAWARKRKEKKKIIYLNVGEPRRREERRKL